MIAQALPGSTRDDDLVAGALALFSSAFSALERAGRIVREFPDSRETNIWVFGYLLDAVATAAYAPVFEKRRFDHTDMLTELVSALEWQGHVIAAQAARTRMDSARCVEDLKYEDDGTLRLGHMRRFLNFAMGLAAEMDTKGLWPANDGLDRYRAAFYAATAPGSTPSYLLDVRDLIDDMVREVEPASPTGAQAILRFRTWRPSIY